MMKTKCSSFGLRTLAIVLSFLAVTVTFTWLGLSSGIAMAQEFTRDFRLEDCEFVAGGENAHFILIPGYKLLLEGEEDGEEVEVLITVTNRTRNIFLPDIGVVTTRVVEEREWIGEDEEEVLVEVSRNFFARCKPTNDIFYFGEDVFICEDGLVQNGNNFLCNGEEPSHEGAWLAGKPDDNGLAEPGIIMPGTFLLGSRYFQEIADGIALDRAKHVKMGLTVTTEAGTFDECVQVNETTPLEPDVSIKKYCPGVGLVVDGPAKLEEFGFNISDDDD